ncbi:hypothetical protein [Ensifer aridi]|uniref:hypothetical protein n=1 Tax=Ensifer aridi TaxID=1708715 RepID=UPI000A0FC3D2|nr:hypothetical protein [Ensifer aridi]
MARSNFEVREVSPQAKLFADHFATYGVAAWMKGEDTPLLAHLLSGGEGFEISYKGISARMERSQHSPNQADVVFRKDEIIAGRIPFNQWRMAEDEAIIASQRDNWNRRVAEERSLSGSPSPSTPEAVQRLGNRVMSVGGLNSASTIISQLRGTSSEARFIVGGVSYNLEGSDLVATHAWGKSESVPADVIDEFVINERQDRYKSVVQRLHDMGEGATLTSPAGDVFRLDLSSNELVRTVKKTGAEVRENADEAHSRHIREIRINLGQSMIDQKPDRYQTSVQRLRNRAVGATLTDLDGNLLRLDRDTNELVTKDRNIGKEARVNADFAHEQELTALKQKLGKVPSFERGERPKIDLDSVSSTVKTNRPPHEIVAEQVADFRAWEKGTIVDFLRKHRSTEHAGDKYEISENRKDIVVLDGETSEEIYRVNANKLSKAVLAQRGAPEREPFSRVEAPAMRHSSTATSSPASVEVKAETQQPQEMTEDDWSETYAYWEGQLAALQDAGAGATLEDANGVWQIEGDMLTASLKDGSTFGCSIHDVRLLFSEAEIAGGREALASLPTPHWTKVSSPEEVESTRRMFEVKIAELSKLDDPVLIDDIGTWRIEGNMLTVTEPEGWWFACSIHDVQKEFTEEQVMRTREVLAEIKAIKEERGELQQVDLLKAVAQVTTEETISRDIKPGNAQRIAAELFDCEWSNRSDIIEFMANENVRWPSDARSFSGAAVNEKFYFLHGKDVIEHTKDGQQRWVDATELRAAIQDARQEVETRFQDWIYGEHESSRMTVVEKLSTMSENATLHVPLHGDTYRLDREKGELVKVDKNNREFRMDAGRAHEKNLVALEKNNRAKINELVRDKKQEFSRSQTDRFALRAEKFSKDKEERVRRADVAAKAAVEHHDHEKTASIRAR